MIYYFPYDQAVEKNRCFQKICQKKSENLNLKNWPEMK